MGRKKAEKNRARPSLGQVVREIAEKLEHPIGLVAFLGRLVYAGVDLDQPTTERALELLDETGLVVISGKRITPKATVLPGSRVLARLSDDELEDGVLLPEQRLMGLAPPGIEVGRYQFVGPNQEALAVRRVTRPLYQFAEHAPLVVPQDLLRSVEAQHRHSADSAYYRRVDLPAVEIGDLLTQSDAEEPPLLEIELLSFLDAVFRVTVATEEAVRGTIEQQQRWLDWMDRELGRAFECHGPDVDAPTQLAHAYTLGPKTMRTRPRFALEEYLERTETVAVYTYEGVPILWYAHDEPEPALVFPGFEPSRGARDSLDAIFDDLGIDLMESELVAFFRDAALQGGSEPQQPLRRALAGRELFFHDELQKNSFEELVQELWDQLSQIPISGAERAAAALRAEVLNLIVEQRRWLIGLDWRGIDPAEFPMDETSRLAQLSGRLSQFIEILNEPEALDEFTLKRYEPLIKQLGEALESGRQQVEAAFDSGLDWDEDARPGTRFELVRGGNNIAEGLFNVESGPDLPGYEGADLREAAGERLPRPPCRLPLRIRYRLKIVLDGSAPSIQRTVAVPGNLTLGELHVVIQEAFGWSDTHLHVFEIGQATYAEPSGEIAFETKDHDEHRYFLQDVAPASGKSFWYVYDFGDGWRHLVTVADADRDCDSEPNVSEIRCTDGARSRPPEGIGGMDSYLDLMSAATDPCHEEHAFACEVFGPTFDPERCDLSSVNKRLREFARRRGFAG